MRDDRQRHTQHTTRQTTGSSGRAPLRRLFAMCMLMLGFAVVCWGLHDKLSLYAQPHAAPPVAKAKLLTEQERTPQMHAAVPRPPVPLAPVFVVLFAAVLRMLLKREPRGIRREPRSVRLKAPPMPVALRRRPPPTYPRALSGAAPVISPAFA